MKTYLEEKEKSNPLIILDMLLVFLIPCLINSRMGHIHPHSLPVGGTESVGGMYPAVCVQHLLGDISSMHAHDGRAHVLPDKAGLGNVMRPENSQIGIKVEFTRVLGSSFSQSCLVVTMKVNASRHITVTL